MDMPLSLHITLARLALEDYSGAADPTPRLALHDRHARDVRQLADALRAAEHARDTPATVRVLHNAVALGRARVFTPSYLVACEHARSVLMAQLGVRLPPAHAPARYARSVEITPWTVEIVVDGPDARRPKTHRFSRF